MVVFHLLLTVISEVIIPSFIVVNLSNDGYFLPTVTVETEQQLLDFLDGVLDGRVQVSWSGCNCRQKVVLGF